MATPYQVKMALWLYCYIPETESWLFLIMSSACWECISRGHDQKAPAASVVPLQDSLLVWDLPISRGQPVSTGIIMEKSHVEEAPFCFLFSLTGSFR